MTRKLLSMLLLLLPALVWGQEKTYTAASTPTVWSSVEAGKWYKFQQGGDLASYHMTTDGTYMRGTTGTALDEASVWMLEGTAGNYKIKNEKGEYIAVSTATAAKFWACVSTDAAQAAVFTLSLGSANANNCLFTITTPPANGFAYLHFDASANGDVANCGFYHDANGKNSQFQLYEVTITEGGTEPGPDPEPEPQTGVSNFEAGKTYVINRNGNSSAYIYDNTTNMSTAALDDNGNCFWLFEATGNVDCYYIKNARTGRYMQSSVTPGLSQLVALGDRKMEFKVGHDNTGNAATWWIASTDNSSFQTDTDGPLGLNFGSNGVVSYYIKTGRGNSYWTITQRDMPNVTPDPGTDEDLLTNLDQLVNGAAYTIKSQRGVLFCSDTQLWGSAGVGTFTENAEDAYQQFAILKSATGKYYLYNVGAQKFVQGGIDLSETPAQWSFVLNPNGDYRWLLNSRGNYINMQNAGQTSTNVIVNSWSTADQGNRMLIRAVADVNVDDALAAIEQYEEDLKKPVAKPALAKRLGIVRIPCGARAAYLTAMSVADYAYTAASAPASAYVNFKTTDFFTLMQGKEYTLNLTAAGTSEDTDMRVFVDWDNDGVYEAIDANSGTVELEVPADAALADTYLRVRLTDNGLLEMDNDVEGTVYDFRMRVVADPNGSETGIVGISGTQTGKTYTIDGRRVHNPQQPGLYIMNGKKYIYK